MIKVILAYFLCYGGWSFASLIEPKNGGFISGTVVVSKGEAKLIDDIFRGETVLAGDGSEAEIKINQVLFKNEMDLIEITVFGKKITMAEDTWVFSQGAKDADNPTEILNWIMAKDLEKGMEVYSLTFGDNLPITKVKQIDGYHDVYNLEMDSIHTFYVGEMGLLVHNARFPRVKFRTPVWVEKSVGNVLGALPPGAKQMIIEATKPFSDAEGSKQYRIMKTRDEACGRQTEETERDIQLKYGWRCVSGAFSGALVGAIAGPRGMIKGAIGGCVSFMAAYSVDRSEEAAFKEREQNRIEREERR